ncbi:MAG: type II and III secretion system protein family protein [Henriciella sp.]
MTPLKSIVRGSAAALVMGLAPLGAFAQHDSNSNPMGVSSLDPGETGVTRTVKLGVNKSIIIDLDRPASDVIITNPEIADATVQTSRRIIFRGVTVGQTNAFVFDVSGRPLLNLEIDVDMDTAVINEMIKRYVPDARVTVESANSNLVISGLVDNLVQSDQISRLVSAYLPNDGVSQVVNMMTIRAKDQVMLEVRIVEMQRTMIKQLGINLSGTTNFGDFANLVEKQLFLDNGSGIPVNAETTALFPGLPFTNRFVFNNSNSFAVQGGSLGGLNTEVGYTNYNGTDVQSAAGAAIDALERVGVVRTLAEPNIMAVSGESAKFLAGGEFPVPVAQEDDQITIEFKPFGVGLAFTPVVLSEGRISLKVSTEISELSNQGAFQASSTAGITDQGQIINVQGITIPSLVVRRAESVVELPSGGSTMLAGLIQSRTRQTLDQLPGIKKIPVLGTLFQSRDFENQETEMVVIITPYLVDPTQKDKLKTPADGFVNAADPKTIFFGKLNAQYAEPGKGLSKDNYSAPVGFIEE